MIISNNEHCKNAYATIRTRSSLETRQAGTTMRIRTRQIVILTTVLSASLLCGADRASYRGLTLESNLETIAQQAGLKSSDAKLVHQRPVVIQEIELKPQIPLLADPPRLDPVDRVVLSFMDGKLYRIAVNYDRYRVKGMTLEDMVYSISSVYGLAKYPETEIAFPSYYATTAKVLAQWEDAESAYDLVRTNDQFSFALVFYSKKLDALAQAAILEAARLDELDAPQKAIEAEARRAEDERRVLEKVRMANKANFRP